MLQSQINMTENDKLIFTAHYMNPDFKQGVYELEYNKVFERMTLDLKYSPMGYTFSGVTTLTKGTFLGFEILYSVKKQILSIGYEYCSRFFPSFIS